MKDIFMVFMDNISHNVIQSNCFCNFNDLWLIEGDDIMGGLILGILLMIIFGYIY